MQQALSESNIWTLDDYFQNRNIEDIVHKPNMETLSLRWKYVVIRKCIVQRRVINIWHNRVVF